MSESCTKSTLLAALIGLGRSAEGNKNRPDFQTHQLLLSGLKMLGNAAITENEMKNQIALLHEQKYRLVDRCLTCKKQCGRNDDYNLWKDSAESGQIVVLKYALLALAQTLGSIINCKKMTDTDAEILSFLYDALYWLGKEDNIPSLLTEIEKGSMLLRKVLI